MEMLRGVRDEAGDARRSSSQENRRYARRQLIWFRKEPTLIWFDGPGESIEVRRRVSTRSRHAGPREESSLDDARA
jgi:tRNA A37 N6-isopentenylltransferase MiaA